MGSERLPYPCGREARRRRPDRRSPGWTAIQGLLPT